MARFGPPEHADGANGMLAAAQRSAAQHSAGTGDATVRETRSFS
jgi:hypothetical protein